MGEHKKHERNFCFFGFRNGELVTVVLSKISEVENAIDVDYYVEEPREAKKQVATWLKKT